MSEENQEQEEQKPTLKDDVTSVAGDLIKNRVARGAGKAGAQSVGSASVSAGTSAVSSAASSGAASAATSGAASAGSSAIAGAGGAAGIAGAAVGEVKNLGESIKEGDATGVVDSGVRVAGIGAATYFGGFAVEGGSNVFNSAKTAEMVVIRKAGQPFGLIYNVL